MYIDLKGKKLSDITIVYTTPEGIIEHPTLEDIVFSTCRNHDLENTEELIHLSID